MAAISNVYQLAAPLDLISDCRLLRLEVHLVAKPLQPPDQVVLCLLAIDAVKIIAASLFVFESFAQRMPGCS
jgi:hypothetical protein